MITVRITVIRKAEYPDLIKEYELPTVEPCPLKVGDVFYYDGDGIPEGFCPNAYETLAPYIEALYQGQRKLYGDWMKDEGSALLCCNDGFRPVSFLLEAIEE